jgi:hypothetical protein
MISEGNSLSDVLLIAYELSFLKFTSQNFQNCEVSWHTIYMYAVKKKKEEEEEEEEVPFEANLHLFFAKLKFIIWLRRRI